VVIAPVGKEGRLRLTKRGVDSTAGIPTAAATACSGGKAAAWALTRNNEDGAAGQLRDEGVRANGPGVQQDAQRQRWALAEVGGVEDAVGRVVEGRVSVRAGRVSAAGHPRRGVGRGRGRAGKAACFLQPSGTRVSMQEL
jgi:hypothetical protein